MDSNLIPTLAYVSLIYRMAQQLQATSDAHDDMPSEERQAIRALIDEANEF